MTCAAGRPRWPRAGRRPRWSTGVADVDGKVVFVFPGQGAQWAGMGARLLDESPVFAERFGECAVALSAFVDWSPADVLRQVPGAPPLERVDVVQPVSFAVMVSLAALWQSHGVVPGRRHRPFPGGDRRGRRGGRAVARRRRPGGGPAQPGDRGGAVRDRRDGVGVAAGRRGDRAAGRAGRRHLDRRGQRPALRRGLAATRRRWTTWWPAWSPRASGPRSSPWTTRPTPAHVERLRGRLLTGLAPVRPQAARVPLLSTVTGDRLDTTGMDADYWYRNLRQTVRFGPAVEALLGAGHRIFVEVSPQPVLTAGVEDAVEEAGVTAVVVGTLRRDHGGMDRFLTSLAEAFVRGAPAGLSRVLAGLGGRRVTLPTYAFQHERYWAVPAGPRQPGTGPAADAGFWSAVEREDAESLAADLAPRHRIGDRRAARAGRLAPPPARAVRRGQVAVPRRLASGGRSSPCPP